MSSFWTGYHGVALVMEEKDFEGFKEKYKNIYQIGLDEEFDEDPLNEYEFIASNPDTKAFKIAGIWDDCCEGAALSTFLGTDGKKNVFCLDEFGKDRNPYFRDTQFWVSPTLYVVFADKQMDGFDAFSEKPYASYEELRQEFKNKLERYLPEDFDWDAHIGNFRYACYA